METQTEARCQHYQPTTHDFMEVGSLLPSSPDGMKMPRMTTRRKTSNQTRFRTYDQPQPTPPLLTHDSDSEDSDDSEEEQEESHGFEVDSVPESPTTSISETESARFEADEKDDGMRQHRTRSHWNLLRHTRCAGFDNVDELMLARSLGK